MPGVRSTLGTVGLLAAAAAPAAAQVFDAGVPAGYRCLGSCGTSLADGDVTTAPAGGARFGFVSTSGGLVHDGLGAPLTTNGSRLISAPFTATAGQTLSFTFNYVTTDSAGMDYAYTRLIPIDPFTPSSLLLTVRSALAGNAVPGGGLPATVPGALLPSPSPVIPDGPLFDGPEFFGLGGSSGNCYEVGCGYTGWLALSYTVPTAGPYRLEFGVYNVSIQPGEVGAFQSVLAFDYGVGPGGVPTLVATPVPEPGTCALVVTGLAAVAAFGRRRRAAA